MEKQVVTTGDYTNDYLRGQVEGWNAAAADRIASDPGAFAGYSEQYIQGYLAGAEECLTSFGSRQAAREVERR